MSGASGRRRSSAAKVSTQYAKENDKFTLIGALMGDTVLDADGVGALATLPTLDEVKDPGLWLQRVAW